MAALPESGVGGASGDAAMLPRRRWTADEYQRAAELGVFRADERLELIRGEILEKMPTNPPRDTSVGLVAEALARAFSLADACIR
jgi:Uma2 family endonuclease